MSIFSNKRSSAKDMTDEELVVAYSDSKGEVYLAELYNRYSHLVYGSCLKYLKNVSEAQDATMDIFEALVEKIPKHRPSKAFRYWLYSLTKNECFSRLRKDKKERTSSLSDTENEEITFGFVENEGFLRLNAKGNKKIGEEELENAMDALRAEQRDCIKLFYLDRKSYLEITDILGMPAKMVKSHIQNGKRNLKKMLQGNTTT